MEFGSDNIRMHVNWADLNTHPIAVRPPSPASTPDGDGDDDAGPPPLHPAIPSPLHLLLRSLLLPFPNPLAPPPLPPSPSPTIPSFLRRRPPPEARGRRRHRTGEEDGRGGVAQLLGWGFHHRLWGRRRFLGVSVVCGWAAVHTFLVHVPYLRRRGPVCRRKGIAFSFSFWTGMMNVFEYFCCSAVFSDLSWS